MHINPPPVRPPFFLHLADPWTRKLVDEHSVNGVRVPLSCAYISMAGAWVQFLQQDEGFQQMRFLEQAAQYAAQV